MEPFETDQGTLQLLAQMDADARRRLKAFLARCDAMRSWSGTTTETFDGSDFQGRTDILDVKLERKVDKTRKVLATIRFRNGTIWRRGQLRIPDAILSQTMRGGIKGLPLEDVVGGAPFTGFTITGSVHDSGNPPHLRIRCTAEQVGPIPA